MSLYPVKLPAMLTGSTIRIFWTAKWYAVDSRVAHIFPLQGYIIMHQFLLSALKRTGF
jgi:hypothetical protein